MTRPPEDSSTARRRWPLRVGLSACLLGLIALNVDVKGLPHVAPGSTSTTSRPATSTSATPSSTRPTTTTTVLLPPHVAPPVTSPAALNPSRRGCGFSMGVVTTPTTSSTSTSVPTSSSDVTTSTTATTTTAARATVGARALGRCVVLEIGDSLGNDLGWGLAREVGPAAGLTFVQLDKSSSGLANGWFFDWPSHLRAALAQYRPNLVIICLGGNDEQAMKVNGRSTAFATPEWIRAYTAYARQLVTAATAAGSYVLWVGMPIMGPAGYRQGMSVLNSVYAKVAGSTPGSAYLPTWGLFANARGQFATTGRVGGVATVLRSPDGIHFSYVGENVFATYVARQLGAIFHVRLVPVAPAVITY